MCCSATAQTVDEAWAASPASQDTQWAQVNSSPVSPSNSGSNGTVTFYSVVGSNAGATNTNRSAEVYAACPAGTKVVSGGGGCDQSGPMVTTTYNQPQGNGWLYGCGYGFSSPTFKITAWVGCQ